MLSDDPAWQVVSLDVLAGVVRSSHLRGEASFLLRVMQTPGGVPASQNARDAVLGAGAAFVTFYREVAALAWLGLETLDAPTDQARERMHRQAVRQAERVEAATERLDRRL